MKTDVRWDLIRAGKTEEGLRLLKNAYGSKPDASHIMELGAAYLWLREYREAWEHFKKAIDTYPRSNSAFFGMAGVAKWCLNDPEEAVKQWRAGLQAEYA